MFTGQTITDLEILVSQVVAANFLGPCCGFESCGSGDGQNIVPCKDRGVIHLTALELDVCEQCFRKGTY